MVTLELSQKLLFTVIWVSPTISPKHAFSKKWKWTWVWLCHHHSAPFQYHHLTVFAYLCIFQPFCSHFRQFQVIAITIQQSTWADLTWATARSHAQIGAELIWLFFGVEHAITHNFVIVTAPPSWLKSYNPKLTCYYSNDSDLIESIVAARRNRILLYSPPILAGVEFSAVRSGSEVWPIRYVINMSHKSRIPRSSSLVSSAGLFVFHKNTYSLFKAQWLLS